MFDDRQALPFDWFMGRDCSGRKRYYNMCTGENTYDMPIGVPRTGNSTMDEAIQMHRLWTGLVKRGCARGGGRVGVSEW